jgi:hypothetical protein
MQSPHSKVHQAGRAEVAITLHKVVLEYLGKAMRERQVLAVLLIITVVVVVALELQDLFPATVEQALLQTLLEPELFMQVEAEAKQIVRRLLWVV